jgi:hypothetical protein
MYYFVYLWFDKSRKMFYVGSHQGDPSDGYISSSPWFNGEYQYRSKDFKRRILSFHKNKTEMFKEEYRLISSFSLHEFGNKYYNLRCSRLDGKVSDITRRRISEATKGRIPWNKGIQAPYSKEAIKKMSESKKGKVPWNKGKKESLFC